MIEAEQGHLFPSIEDCHERDVRARWRHLVEHDLPNTALERNWPIVADHCFARILLDVTSGRPWREIISPPAWRHAPIVQLEQAIGVGEGLLEGTESIDDLNEASLTLRRRTEVATPDKKRIHRRCDGGRNFGEAGAERS